MKTMHIYTLIFTLAFSVVFECNGQAFKLGNGTLPSAVTAKKADLELLARKTSSDFVLEVSQIKTSSSVVISLKNQGLRPMPYMYDDQLVYGFRCRVYDMKKNPIDVKSLEGWSFAYRDGSSRLGSSRFTKLNANDTIAIQVDLSKYFKISSERPTWIFLSVWWYSAPGASIEPYPYPDVSIWARINMK